MWTVWAWCFPQGSTLSGWDDVYGYIKESRNPVKVGYHSPTSAPRIVFEGAFNKAGLKVTENANDPDCRCPAGGSEINIQFDPRAPEQPSGTVGWVRRRILPLPNIKGWVMWPWIPETFRPRESGMISPAASWAPVMS